MRDAVVWHRSFLPKLELPDRFAEATPHQMPANGILPVVQRYLANFWEAADLGLAPLFTGSAGKWKTYGAAVIARWVDWQRVPVKWVEAGPYFMRADMLFYDSVGRELLEAAEAAPFLVLDDFTQCKPASRPAELMANVVARRFAERRPTLVTGNVLLPDTAALAAVAAEYRADFARRLWHGSEGYRANV